MPGSQRNLLVFSDWNWNTFVWMYGRLLHFFEVSKDVLDYLTHLDSLTHHLSFALASQGKIGMTLDQETARALSHCSIFSPSSLKVMGHITIRSSHASGFGEHPCHLSLTASAIKTFWMTWENRIWLEQQGLCLQLYWERAENTCWLRQQRSTTI